MYGSGSLLNCFKVKEETEAPSTPWFRSSWSEYLRIRQIMLQKFLLLDYKGSLKDKLKWHLFLKWHLLYEHLQLHKITPVPKNQNLLVVQMQNFHLSKKGTGLSTIWRTKHFKDVQKSRSVTMHIL